MDFHGLVPHRRGPDQIDIIVLLTEPRLQCRFEMETMNAAIPEKLDRAGVFRQMCYIRHFELQVAQACQRELIPGVVYLAVGQEAVSATVARRLPCT